MRIRRSSISLAILFLFGCAGVESVPTGQCNLNPKSCTGATYYLPKRKVSLSISRFKDVESNVCIDHIKLELLKAEPDLDHQYTVKPKHLIIRSDNFVLGINSRGLLDSSEVSDEQPELSEDRTLLIDNKIVVADEVCIATSFARIYDPTDYMQTQLPLHFRQYQIKVYEPERIAEAFRNDKTINWIIYRRSIPYLFVFETCDQNECTPREASQAMIPNKGSVGILPFSGSFFVDSKYRTEFRDGELVRWEVERPAGATAIIKVPFELIGAAIAAPAQVINSVTP